MLRRLPALTLLTTAAVFAASSPALADGLGQASCDRGDPSCTARAKSRNIAEPAQSASVQPQVTGNQNGSDKQRTCRDSQGRKVPCYSEAFGWMGSDGCYYKQTTFSPGSPEVARQMGKTGSGPGAWYQATCPGVAGTGGGIRWLPTSPESGQASRVPPVVVARRARDKLQLPAPAIHASPGPSQVQLVQLPIWLWVGSPAWDQRSASASAGPVSATVSAKPTKVVWSMGDGTRVVCHGPGTPYEAGANPSKPSPTCGHTYTESSAGEPKNAYQVTARMTWTITWSGGGQQGTFEPMSTTATTSFRVAESQGIVTDARTR